MAQVYENDVTKVGGNLQKTVAYLLSLHKAEYEWNMLGIKVIGHVDALPIPDGTYEYGDTYMVGTTTPYDMWIYTRADEFHATDYWFNVGKFPQPGPQGPKGDGLEQIIDFDDGPVQSVTYDTTHGAMVESHGAIGYTDITTGKTKRQEFGMQSRMPIVPGKYISMDTNTLNDALEIKVDDTNLAQDYWKISKTDTASVPYWNGATADAIRASSYAVPNSMVLRDSSGDTSVNKIGVNYICDTNYNNVVSQLALARTVIFPDNNISETSSDSGVLNATDYQIAKEYQNTRIVYKNKEYYCMDPRTAPDGTLNFIHIDTVQTGGGYAARGKCFSITTSTRAWKVVDISLGPRTHQLTITDNETNAKTYLTLVSNRTTVYSADELITDMGDSSFPCTLDSVQNDTIYAGVITAIGNQFTVSYSNHQEFNMTDAQVTITDYVV